VWALTWVIRKEVDDAALAGTVCWSVGGRDGLLRSGKAMGLSSGAEKPSKACRYRGSGSLGIVFLFGSGGAFGSGC
jgi:hypothetical protein